MILRNGRKKTENIYGGLEILRNKMVAVVVDTDILVDYTHGKARWIDEMSSTSRPKMKLVIPTPVIAEFFVSQKFADLSTKRAAIEFVDNLFVKQDFNSEIAHIWADLTRNNVFPAGAGTIDTMVAATAIYLKAPLATRNIPHYQGIPGLIFFTS